MCPIVLFFVCYRSTDPQGPSFSVSLLVTAEIDRVKWSDEYIDIETEGGVLDG